MDKVNPASRVTVSDDLDVETDLETGQTRLVNRPGKHMKIATKGTNLDLYKTIAGDKWEGLGFEWLKYVTQHEYGHMQTLGMVSTAANQPMAVRPNGNANPESSTPGGLMDMDEINRYLAARVPALKAVRVRTAFTHATATEGSQFDYYDDHIANGEDVDPRHFTLLAWELNPNYMTPAQRDSWTREKVEDIFGNDADVYDPNSAPYHIDPDEFIDKLLSRKTC